MKKIRLHKILSVATSVFIALFFTLTSFAQKPGPSVAGAAPLNPHDFTDSYYIQNGVHYKGIIWRRNGADGLSVFDDQRYTNYRDVRVTVTVPAYTQGGEPYFWYPLGELTNAGFTEDTIGIMAMQMAKLFPIYLFPDEKYITYNTIVNTRQAPLIDNSLAWYVEPANPLGLREVFLVNYSKKAHSVEGVKIMQYMREKNGTATDGMPIIKTLVDLQMLHSEGYLTMDYGDSEKGPGIGHFVMAPVLTNPTKGVIAKDAFLWMSTRDGNPLKAEMFFVDQFNCLQQTGEWCQQ